MEAIKRYFVSAIDTDAGKTVVSAVLSEALQADYWKPVQCGDLHNSDTDKIKALISNSTSEFHPNTYALKEPASPHYSAALEDVSIDLNQFKLPTKTRNLIIEGAGGLLVPLNDKDLVIDLIAKLEIEVIFVIKNYLGSINHSLLSIEALQRRNIGIRGIIFNGDMVASSEDYILAHSKVPFLGRIPQLEDLNRHSVKQLANQFEFLKHD